MSDLSITLTVRPPTVAAAVYGVMTVVAEHTSSIVRLDDLRIALDELFHALPQDEDVRVEIDVDVAADRSHVEFRADARDVLVDPGVRALVDDLNLEHGRDRTRARLAVAHD